MGNIKTLLEGGYLGLMYRLAKHHKKECESEKLAYKKICECKSECYFMRTLGCAGIREHLDKYHSLWLLGDDEIWRIEWGIPPWEKKEKQKQKRRQK